DVGDVYYATLVHHLGCTAPAHEMTRMAGDDLTFLVRAERTDSRNPREALALLAGVGRGAGASRLRYVVRTATTTGADTRRMQRAVCEVGARFADRLG